MFLSNILNDDVENVVLLFANSVDWVVITFSISTCSFHVLHVFQYVPFNVTLVLRQFWKTRRKKGFVKKWHHLEEGCDKETEVTGVTKNPIYKVTSFVNSP